MQPEELLTLCRRSIAERHGEGDDGAVATVMLVVPRVNCPKGRTVALFGTSGPRGRIATVKETRTGYDIVAYFRAAAIVDALAGHLDVVAPHNDENVPEKPTVAA